ncbi:MAG: two-component system sensor histidine kinase NtrB, partial [Gemmatimonadaceae bacterium]
DIDVMRRLLPSAPLIMPNTALVIVVLAITTTLLDGTSDRRRRQLAGALGAVVALFGVVTVLQHAFNVSLPSDLWLFGDKVLATSVEMPGRASRAAGRCFVLLGSAQLLIAVRGTARIETARVIGAIVLIVALSASINSADNAPAIYPLSRLIGMALPTALALAALAGGIIALHSTHGVMADFTRNGPAGQMARWLVPPTLLAPPLLAVMVVRGRMAGWYGPTVSVSILLVLSMATLLTTIVWLTITAARLEDSRQNAERREATTFHLAAIGVAHFDVEGRLLRANQRFAEMFAMTPERLVGANWHDFVIGERIPTSEQLTRLELGELQSVQVERPFRRADGTEVWVRANVSVAHTADDQPAFHIVVADDISERRRLQEETRELDQRVERVARLESIGALAGGVAHDFNNILVSILGNANFARAEVPPDSKLARHLEEVETAARRATDLTGQLLAYAGKSMRRPEPVALEALATAALRVFEPSVRDHLTLHVEHGACPPVMGDAAQLRQVLLALLSNAAEALGDGPGVITVRTGAAGVRPATPGSTWWPAALPAGRYGFLEVGDDGPGIEAYVLAHLFEPFASTKFTGRGLGLAAVLGIARVHHGAIEVENAPGKGARFRVWLPLNGSSALSA